MVSSVFRELNPSNPALILCLLKDPHCRLTLSVRLSFHSTGQCEPGPWGGWSPCAYNGKTCGSAWGLETRVREAGRAGHEETTTCQVLSESRKCPIQRPCPGGEPQDRHMRLWWERPTGTEWTQDTAPQIVPMRLPERPPLTIPSCGVHIVFPGVLSKEDLPCWVQSRIH